MGLKFEFSYKTEFADSFRTKSLVGQYDLEQKTIVQNFKGELNLPENWSIGLIVGNSGTGKTSISKACFGEFDQCQWDNRSIIENFNDDVKMEQITYALGSVGFNSVPYWLKPFHVLSNGEKSRVELARLALEKDIVKYDEFTSLVDRDVAKSMSHSVQKLFRKMKKQLVAVTCHHDVMDWLKPDWVYDTDKSVFFCPNPSIENSSNSPLNALKNARGNIIKSIII